MTLSLDAEISTTGTILCRLSTAGPTLTNPVICFSLHVPPDVLSGGTLLEFLGGFGAVKLDGTLSHANPLDFELAHQVRAFKAANRAWLPLGAYIRHEDGTTTPVQTGPSGVIAPEVAHVAPEGLGLVPVPTRWQPAGDRLSISAFDPGNNGSLAEEITAISALAERTGQPAFTVPGSVPLTCQPADMAADAYQLEIRQDAVSLTYGSANAGFHGLVSLLVLRAVHAGKVPCGTITDQPRFDWRGQHLDCARHFYQTDTIERLLDVMALLKLNRFHWHFADDEAFRLEVDCHPDLWQKSAFRGEGQTLPGVFGGSAGPTGGTYSKADAAHIVAHAAALKIDVLPEIEVPAHALAITEIFPHLRDPDDTGTEQSVQGYHRNTVNPALPATWDFLEPLATEVASLFPFAHLHLGGDELPDNTWAGSPLVDQFKREHNLADHVDVQGHTMDRIAGYIREQGIVPCAWEEAALGCQGGIGNDAILFSWTGQGPGLEAARRGYRVVMCPAQHTYWDMARTNDPNDWGANWAANFGLSETLNWDPIPLDEPELAKTIIGVEGAFWGEFTTQDWEMEAMIAPRILGLSVMGWSPRDTCTPKRLRELALGFQAVFGPMNWQVNGNELV